MTTKIVKWGNSQGIRLHKHVLEKMGLTSNDSVDVVVDNNSIIIKKSFKKPSRKTIKDLFENYDGAYETTTIDWGTPVGKEIW